MTLDPVHFEGIAALARQVGRDVDDSEHQGFAETVWDEFLDPLAVDGRTVLEPIDERFRGSVSIDDVALCERPFPTSHGLDSGTINPTTYKNGVVLDVAHAALGCVPTDLDSHRSRSLVIAAHLDDESRRFSTDWLRYDDGHSQRRILHVRNIGRYTEGVVHALALYLAESHHARWHADRINDLLVLDGPLYPKEVLSWRDRHPELAAHLEEELPRRVVENYLRLVEDCLDRGVPIAGFVKNPSAKRITRALPGDLPTPWADDAALFTRLLERRDGDERVRDELTYTNWFVSRGGTDRTLAADGDALGLSRRLSPDQYEVTFFVVYDPRDDVLYKVEAPSGVTDEATTRKRLRRQLLVEIATERGPPRAVAKADELARISAAGKESLRKRIEEEWNTDRAKTYDQLRWPDVESV